MRGLAWKGASQVALQIARIAVAVVLARLLTPDEYGLATMVLVFSSLVIVFSDFALGAVLVQRRELSEADRSTVFWSGAFIGAAFTVLGVLLSGRIASFYGQPTIEPMFAVLSLTFFLTALGTTQASLMTREMDFRSLEVRLILATFAGAAVGIALAAAGYGAWAIVGQQLVTTAISTILLWLLSPWRPQWTFSVGTLRRFGGFSANVFGQRLLYYLHRNVDNLLIGRYLGPAQLGAYSVAYNAMLVPFSRLAAPLQEVFFPAFARIQHDTARIAEIWIRLTRVVAALSMPALVGLIVVAPDFVPVVLGKRWTDAVPVLQVLAIVGLLQSLQTMNGDILQALDRTSTLLRYTVVFFCAHLAAFASGLHWGILGVAIGYAISSSFVEPLFAWVTARAIGVPLTRLLKALSGVTQATLGMLVVVVAARLFALDDASPLERLLALTAVGVISYVPLCFWRVPEVVDEIRELRQRRAGARAARVAALDSERLASEASR